MGARVATSRIAHAGLAIWCFATGLAYLPPLGALPEQLALISRVTSGHVFGAAWILAAVLLVAGQWFYHPRQIGLALTMSLTLLLAGGYFTAWLFEDQTRAWVSVKNYLMLAGAIMVMATNAEKVMPGAPTK